MRRMPPMAHVDLLVDAATMDDAAVYRVRDDLAIVATIDVFTPIVDDPYDFGAIAAANALSDVYAMAATPIFALNLAGFPRDTLSLDVLAEIQRGGAEDCARGGRRGRRRALRGRSGAQVRHGGCRHGASRCAHHQRRGASR